MSPARRSPALAQVVYRDADGLTTAQRQLVELAEDWLAVKRARASDHQVTRGSSERARRTDLCRIGRLICHVTGRTHADWGAPGDLVVDLGRCTLADLNAEVLARVLDAARTGYEPATVRRTVSTLRGFTRWANARGHLRTDPADDELRLPPPVPLEPRGLEPDAVDALRAAAGMEPAARSRGLCWPARDVALVEVLARCGLRAEEVCTAETGWIDRRPDQPVLRVLGKGGKKRDVPIPTHAVDALDVYLTDRAARLPHRRTGTAPLFVRTDGRPLATGVLDRLVRLWAQRAGILLPAGAAAHSLRHHYGTTLALHGVHMALISQLMGHADPKTSATYTRVASHHLIDALADAGLLS